MTQGYVRGAALSDRGLKLAAAADAGVYLAIDNLRRSDNGETLVPLPLDGTPRSVSFDGFNLTVSVQDTGGRIDLNTARPALLAALLQGVGAEPDVAAQVADEIADWRDPDGNPTGRGGETRAYVEAQRTYGPKNGPFVSTSEIVQVLHFEPRWLGRIEPFVTVHSGLTGIDPTRTKPELMALLGAGSQSDVATSDPALRSYFTSASGRSFVVRSEATRDSSVFVREAVVRFNPAGTPAMDILDWRRARADTPASVR